MRILTERPLCFLYIIAICVVSSSSRNSEVDWDNSCRIFNVLLGNCKVCTIHFFQYSGTMPLQEYPKDSDKCRLQITQTVQLFHIYNFSDPGRVKQRVHRPYLRPFYIQKFHETCLIHLPLSYEYNNFETFLHGYKTTYSKWPSAIPNLVIIPILWGTTTANEIEVGGNPTTENISCPRPRIRLPRGQLKLAWPFNLLIFNFCPSKKVISYACFTCFSFPHTVELISTAIIPKSYEEIIVTFTAINSNLNSHAPHPSLIKYRDGICDRFYNRGKWNMSEYLHKIKHENSRTANANNEAKKCPMGVLLNRMNCTLATCQTEMQDFYRFASFPNKVSRGVKLSVGSYDAMFVGYTFSLYVPKSEVKTEIDLLFLFQTFKLHDWIFLGALYLIVGIVLQITTDVPRPFYWLYGVLLGQNEIDIKSVRVQDGLIFVGWFFSAFLIQNLFPGKMFSHLTHPLDPKDLPTSGHDLMHNDKMDLMIDEQFLESLGPRDNHTASIYERLIILNGNGPSPFAQEDMYSLFTYTPDLLKNISQQRPVQVCSRTEVTFMVWRCMESDEKVLKRFAIVHRNLPQPPVTKSFVFLSPLLSIFSNRKVYRNSANQINLTELRYWSARGPSILIPIFRWKLAQISESGILERINKLFANDVTLHNIERVNQNGGFNKTWNVGALVWNILRRGGNHRLDMNENVSDYESINCKALNAVWMLYLMMQLLAIFVMLIEISHFCNVW